MASNAPLRDRSNFDMPVFIVEHQQELDTFVGYLNNNLDIGSIEKVRTICPLGEKHPASQAAIDFAYAAKKTYLSWKRKVD